VSSRPDKNLAATVIASEANMLEADGMTMLGRSTGWDGIE